MLLAVDPDEVHIKQAGEGLLHEVPLILAHEALIHKDAGQLIAHRPADEARGHGGIHAAGQTQDDLLAADFLPQGLHGVLDEGVHLPLPLAAAHIVQEVPENLIAVPAVGDLGMGLDGVDLFLRVLHGGYGALGGKGGDLIALGQITDPVGVAHPHHGNVLKEQGSFLGHGHVNFAVLGGFGGDDAALCHPADELGAVADAQNRDAQLQHHGIVVGGGHIEYAVGAAGEDDALIVPGLDFLRGDGIERFDLRVDMEIPDSAGDQLIVLTAEV